MSLNRLMNFKMNPEINYYEDYEGKKQKQKFTKKKPCDTDSFLKKKRKKRKPKFRWNSKNDANNSEDYNFTYFDKYDLDDSDKSFEFEDVVIFQRDEKNLSSCDY